MSVSRYLNLSLKIRFRKDMTPKEKGEAVKSVVRGIIAETEEMEYVSVSVGGREVLKKDLIKGASND